MGKFIATVFIGLLIFVASTSYEPRVVELEEFQLINVTDPINVFDGFIKRIESRLEIRSNYQYELVGWNKEDELIYRESSTGSVAIFDPKIRVSKVLTEGIPDEVFGTVKNPLPFFHLRAFSFWKTKQIDLVHDIANNDVEYLVMRDLVLRKDGLVSPSGNYLAVIAEYIYGPQDVVVLKLKSE